VTDEPSFTSSLSTFFSTSSCYSPSPLPPTPSSLPRSQVPLRHPNGQKAHDNYNRKLKFLEAELRKYTSYIDSLSSAMSRRLELRGERALQRTLVRADMDLAYAVGVGGGVSGGKMPRGRASSGSLLNEVEEGEERY
jgi:hypothetical protein